MSCILSYILRFGIQIMVWLFKVSYQTDFKPLMSWIYLVYDDNVINVVFVRYLVSKLGSLCQFSIFNFQSKETRSKVRHGPWFEEHNEDPLTCTSKDKSGSSPFYLILYLISTLIVSFFFLFHPSTLSSLLIFFIYFFLSLLYLFFPFFTFSRSTLIQI